MDIPNITRCNMVENKCRYEYKSLVVEDDDDDDEWREEDNFWILHNNEFP